jgi:ABC-type multidrug transport system fused ATPase/permease subunit
MQEPVLFKTTNLDNIKYGKLDAQNETIRTIADKVEIGQFLEEHNLNTVWRRKTKVSYSEGIIERS